MAIDPRALPAAGEVPDPASPSPGDTIEPGTTTAPVTEEPVAAGPTGVEPQPGAGAQPLEPGTEAWSQLPEWVREEIQRGRRSAQSARDAAIAHGFRIDEGGTWHPPAQPAPQLPPAQQVQPTRTGLPPEREALYEQAYRNAELAENPERARMEIGAQMASEISQLTMLEGLRTILPTTTAGTVAGYKEIFRRDPQYGESFKFAEAEFDALIRQAQEEADKARIPLVFTEPLMLHLRSVAIGQAAPKILAAARSRTTQQRTAAGTVLPQFHTAGGTAAPGPVAPAALSTDEQSILGSLARGAGLDPAALSKGYAQRKARGE